MEQKATQETRRKDDEEHRRRPGSLGTALARRWSHWWRGSTQPKDTDAEHAPHLAEVPTITMPGAPPFTTTIIDDHDHIANIDHTDHGDHSGNDMDVAHDGDTGDLMTAMLPIELLVLIYGRVHREELEAAAAARWSGRWDRVLGGDAEDDHERGGAPGLYRMLTLSRAHHDAVASALADWRSWPDSCYGPGAALWALGVTCTNGRADRGASFSNDNIDGKAKSRVSTYRQIHATPTLHPVLADRRLHGLWFGAGMHLPPCWLGAPARRLLDVATDLARHAAPADEPMRTRWRDALADLLATPAWPTPCLVLCVQVPHGCNFALDRAHLFPTLTLTRTYLCAPGGSAGARFTVGGIVDAVADFYAGSPLHPFEMERVRAHARSVWRAYERHFGRPWDPHDFGPGGGGRPLTAHTDRGSEGGYVIDTAAFEHAPRVMYGRDPYRGGWGPRNDAHERRFASWFSDRWLGEGDLPPAERRLTRQFADPERYGRPRLIDLATRPTYDDPPPRLVVGRFGAGRRRGVCQLSVGFGRMPDA
ncbi:hypothetical protein pclt_cds_788 [Pandoravirus celtis]|uniref:Uncharacterized protein n=1 Tax=Pandoravirus celtis TaxID=2568002 RepID=A0A4D6EHV7_9VIRU|nr:hypothetical protein pclt_cds_788 [Pandoravirus celtis]